MKKYSRLLAVACAALVFAATGAIAADAPKADAPKAEAPKAEAPKAEAAKAEAPKGLAFSVKDSAGKVFKAEELKGKKSMIIIAQTACGACQTEMAAVNAKYDDFAKLAEVYVVLVDVNTARAGEAYKAENYKMKMLVDPGFDVGEAVGITSTPGTVILDKDMKVVYTKTGFRPGQEDLLLKELKK